MNSSISVPLLLHLILAKFSYGLDLSYKSYLFRRVPHLAFKKYPPTNECHRVRLRIKIRFSCFNCKNTWTTFFGTLIINYVIDKNKKELLFDSYVFLQNCHRCGRVPTIIGFSDKEVEVNAFLFLQLSKIILPNAIYEQERESCFAKMIHRKTDCHACKVNACTF